MVAGPPPLCCAQPLALRCSGERAGLLDGTASARGWSSGFVSAKPARLVRPDRHTCVGEALASPKTTHVAGGSCLWPMPHLKHTMHLWPDAFLCRLSLARLSHPWPQ